MKTTRLFNRNNYKMINTLGLSIGITCVFVIMLWVDDELRFDLFNKNVNQIYRVLVEENAMEGYSNSAMTMRPLSDALKEKLPEIEKVANFEMDWNVIVKTGVNYLNEDGLAVVGTDFFDIFSFPFISGNPQLLKSEKYSVVISEKTAAKYFGKEDAIGNQIEINKIPVKVVAVFKNIDYNSHIRFELAIPEELGRNMFGMKKGEGWDSQNLYTYILTSKNTPIKLLETKLLNFVADNIDPASDRRLILQPLKHICFQKNLADEDYTYLGDKRYVYIFSFMGLFILILACVNFINLSTAVSEKDIRNNGIRKVFGASKAELIRSSILKSLFTSGIAACIALFLLYLTIPFVRMLTQKNLSISFSNPVHILTLISVPVFTGLLSGSYPAYYMASVLPLRLVKVMKYSASNWQRNALVVFQFTLSMLLIIATLISLKQLNQIRQMDLGFDKEHTIYFRLKTGQSDYLTLKEKLLNIRGIEKVAGKRNYSPTVLNTTTVSWSGNLKEQVFVDNNVDENFFPLLKVNFINGHNFSKEMNNDNSIIINKKAREIIGIDNPIGMKLMRGQSSFEIIGVIDDVHFRSVNEKIQPEYFTFTKNPDYIFIRYQPAYNAEINHLIDQISLTVKELYPEAPLDYKFLDSTYEKLYEKDKRVGDIFGIVTIIAILISCIGLIGLSSYSSEKRTKEIGIRKISGARIIEILVMLNRDLIVLVGIAYVITVPVAWYAMHKWLQSFAYKTELSWWIFILAGLLALGIALLTVSWQSWRAATRNPVEALRYE
jgi:putative ABC transport system permease protein